MKEDSVAQWISDVKSRDYRADFEYFALIMLIGSSQKHSELFQSRGCS